ncbi:hypothetical protein PG994_012870 [Apiospora phragmitis]|uniref:Uncharacterized protein n=1 Tax=Apiospora phragmitis TaxID=2905665 RepID=A0ABR1T715_9PEZI
MDELTRRRTNFSRDSSHEPPSHALFFAGMGKRGCEATDSKRTNHLEDAAGEADIVLGGADESWSHLEVYLSRWLAVSSRDAKGLFGAALVELPHE